MLVKYWMNSDVVTLDVNDTMQDALSKTKEHRLPLLPVLRKGKLVGIITDRDLKRASASDATTLDVHELAYLIAKIKAEDIMTKHPITVPPDFTLEETAAVLWMNNVSGVPVVDAQGNIVGTISQKDIFRALISLSGFTHRGLQFAFRVEDRPGSIKEVTDIIRKFGARLVSILTSSERAPAGYRNLYVRLYDIDRDKLPALMAELKQKAFMLYMVDHREDTREEYAESSVVPEDKGSPGSSRTFRTKKVMLCTDFSKNSLPARRVAVEYAKTFNAALIIFHVVNPRLLGYPHLEDTIPVDMDELHRKVDEMVNFEIEQAAKSCRQEVDNVETRLSSGDPAVEIVRFAERCAADLIVMATHGWTGLRHMLLGSVAENVLRSAPCPVLIVKS